MERYCKIALFPWRVYDQSFELTVVKQCR